MKESVFFKIDLDDYLKKDIAHISTVPETEHQTSHSQFIPNVIAIEFYSEGKPEEGREAEERIQPTLCDSQDHRKIISQSSNYNGQFALKKGIHDESTKLSSLRRSLLNSYNGYSHLETYHSVFVTGKKWSFKNFFHRLFNG